jgi:hypothetical protein
VFELLHFVQGLRKVAAILFYAFAGEEADPGADADPHRLVSIGPVNICRLWNLQPSSQTEGDDPDVVKFREEMTSVGDGYGDETDGAFDDAFHHFEVLRNLSAFDATRARALLDVGNQQTKEALANLESLMVQPPCVRPSQISMCFCSSHPPNLLELIPIIYFVASRIPPPRPRRPRFRSLKLPVCDIDDAAKKSARLPFLPDDLNSLPIRSDIPYAMLVLNGEPRIMPLSPGQLAELVNNMHL